MKITIKLITVAMLLIQSIPSASGRQMCMATEGSCRDVNSNVGGGAGTCQTATSCSFPGCDPENTVENSYTAGPCGTTGLIRTYKKKFIGKENFSAPPTMNLQAPAKANVLAQPKSTNLIKVK